MSAEPKRLELFIKAFKDILIGFIGVKFYALLAYNYPNVDSKEEEKEKRVYILAEFIFFFVVAFFIVVVTSAEYVEPKYNIEKAISSWSIPVVSALMGGFAFVLTYIYSFVFDEGLKILNALWNGGLWLRSKLFKLTFKRSSFFENIQKSNFYLFIFVAISHISLYIYLIIVSS